MSNNKNGRLLKTTSIYFVGNFASKVLSFLLVPLYTSLLTVSSYGAIDLVLTASQILSPLLSLQVTQGMFRYMTDCKNDQDIAEVISSSFIVILAGSVLLCAVMIPYAIAVRSLEWLIACPFIISGMVNGFVIQETRGLKKNVLYAATSTICSIFQVLSNIVFIVGFSMGSLSLLLAPTLANVISILVLVFNKKMYRYFHLYDIRLEMMKNILRFSVPSIPSALAWWGMTGFSKVYLSYACGTAELGLFSMGNKFSDIIVMVYSIFNLAWTEVAYDTFNDSSRDVYYGNVYNLVTRFLLSLILVAIPMTKIFAPVFIRGEFSEAYVFLPVMYFMCYFNVMGSFLTTIFNSFKKTYYVAIACLPGTVINIVLSILFVPKYGTWGTVLVLAFAMIVYFLSNYYFSMKLIKLRIDYKMYTLFIAIGIMSIVYYYNSLMIQILSAVIGVLIAVFANRQLLFQLYYALKMKLSASKKSG